ncbi:alpha-glucan family phosphorylase [Candidatus Woesearchaeota archaeon]|nr:alpha-glucan family phosphorylase [Candidatus Woesearchaeota archaeon]
MKRHLHPLDKKEDRIIAYFSMEIGLDANIPTYSGGLGILAGDTIKACADLKVPMLAVTLMCQKGYFYQKLDHEGNQTEHPVEWNPGDYMELLPTKIVVSIEGRDVIVQVWEYWVKGVKGYEIPVYFLDTNVPENTDQDKNITSMLYGGDEKFRLIQEVILGIGGVRIMQAIGYHNIQKYHLNEGHSSLLILELLRQTKIETNDTHNFEKVREQCVFTTHTPVPAGHDNFGIDLVKQVLGEFLPEDIMKRALHEGQVNMTWLALENSKYINGVAKKHGEISRDMFPGYPIDSITNGVHSLTWTSEPFRTLYDKHIPGWRMDAFALRYALKISRKEIWDAHMQAKKKLIDFVNGKTNAGMDYTTLTIGFARRCTQYKRPYLLFQNIDKLREIVDTAGKIQVLFAGKAHPKDNSGKELIKNIFSKITQLKEKIKIVYLENYDIEIGKLFTSGVDIWLNTPLKPWEASGTSGMKSCHNGIPNFSVLDGWWIEGHIENITGWSIGPKHKTEHKDHITDDEKDAEDLYYKLEKLIIPMFYNDWDKWTEIMRHTIAFNASFFNTHRMIHQYVLNAYFH